MLKIAGIVLEGGYIFDYQAQPAKPSWAQETLNFPGAAEGSMPSEVTGSVAGQGAAEAGRAGDRAAKPDGVVVYPDRPAQVSASERAVLERLQERRQELETRAREVDIRESLLKAAEKRIEGKVDEMKAVEARISAAAQQKERGRQRALQEHRHDVREHEAEGCREVFDRLDMSVLIEVASRIKPQKMADILAQMSAEAAEKLTVELARRSGNDKAGQSAELPKIEGKMLAPKTN